MSCRGCCDRHSIPTFQSICKSSHPTCHRQKCDFHTSKRRQCTPQTHTHRMLDLDQGCLHTLRRQDNQHKARLRRIRACNIHPCISDCSSGTSRQDPSSLSHCTFQWTQGQRYSHKPGPEHTSCMQSPCRTPHRRPSFVFMCRLPSTGCSRPSGCLFQAEVVKDLMEQLQQWPGSTVVPQLHLRHLAVY